MASWTSQSTSSLLPGEPWTSAKALATFENPEAIAEGASGAPVLSTGWHAYNRTNVGDSNTGIVYDYATDGSVTTIETPNFENNYEYRLLGRNIGGLIGTTRLDLLISGTWYRIYTSSNYSLRDFDFWIRSPRRSAAMFVLDYAAAERDLTWSNSGTAESGREILNGPSSAIVTRARVSRAIGAISSGSLYMLRRRED